MGEVTRDLLHRMFRIDFEHGRMWWEVPPYNHPRLLGKEAGCPRYCGAHKTKSYWVIRIEGKAYVRSRLLFLARYGRWPFPCIDHIDGNSLNDAASNLREATIAENARNHKGRLRRINLPMGVRHAPRGSGRFVARISFNKRQICIGTFATVEEARTAYLAKRKELFRDFA